MFRNTINDTPWSARLDQVYKNIPYHEDSSTADVSLISTVRALLYPRLPEGSLFKVISTARTIGTSYSDDRIINEIEDVIPSNIANSLFFIGLKDDRKIRNDDAKAATLCASENLSLDGYKEVEKVRVFFQKTMGVACFINPEIKSTIIIYDRKGLDTYHYLQCVIPVCMPWFFAEKPVSPDDADEYALIASLRQKTQDDYVKALSILADRYDIASKKSEVMLADFGKSWASKEKRILTDKIKNLNEKIEDYQRIISEYLREIRERQLKLVGVEAQLSTSGNEFAAYFSSNKSLELVDAEDGRLTFIAKGYFEFYDEELAKTVINNDDSAIYETSHDSVDVEKLFTAIFIDHKMRLRSCAAYTLNIAEYSVSGRDGWRFPTGFTYFPNTHIQSYHCLGDYRESMIEALKNNDMITATELCGASVRSLNFADTTVMERLVNDLFSSRMACVELPDGKLMTVKEAIEYLDKEVAEDVVEEETSGQEETKEEE